MYHAKRNDTKENKNNMEESWCKMKKGFFEVGDCIEISGEIVGLVIMADSDRFGLNRLFYSNGSWLLCPDINMYSNEAVSYEKKYWIKKITAPNEYTVMVVKPLKH
ncbi:hypothetical protein FRG77_08095 [Listeria monocytogenes]|uniref:Uncharacterized protein n=3 Tax=Listeria monocytogenes TaxID=1639 RepID=A0A9P1SR68_LISMN|nr:hypothetical protein [Listeria monocytogenes]EAC2302905.1 hypothetical protein [Listeria monocytogenes]EAC5549413.1 hypothetical protein [Listeria monocytogenes]EAC5748238.1 hypothetical protein [Listeria monocytogenes]EAC7929666.1 hypothetical protein [Listeria monocytogenes]